MNAKQLLLFHIFLYDYEQHAFVYIVMLSINGIGEILFTNCEEINRLRARFIHDDEKI